METDKESERIDYDDMFLIFKKVFWHSFEDLRNSTTESWAKGLSVLDDCGFSKEMIDYFISTQDIVPVRYHKC